MLYSNFSFVFPTIPDTLIRGLRADLPADPGLVGLVRLVQLPGSELN